LHFHFSPDDEVAEYDSIKAKEFSFVKIIKNVDIK